VNTDRKLEETLRFDPLSAAESICGTDTEEYLGLGLLLAQGHARVKNRLLTERNDTTLVNTLDRYLHIVTGAGFETVLTMPFEGRSYSDRPAPLETLYVLAHPDGLLLLFDTYGSDHVNSAKVWYNWRPAPLCSEQAYRYTSSGHWVNSGVDTGFDVWAGDHDAREGLIYKLSRLRSTGEFLPQWVEQPFLWLLHYRDTDTPDYDYAAINAERIGLLPRWVQTMITP